MLFFSVSKSHHDLLLNHAAFMAWLLVVSLFVTCTLAMPFKALAAEEMPQDHLGEFDTMQWSVLAGKDRYETMQDVCNESFLDGSSDIVIVATGEDFTDCLAASSLAGVLDAPILLTQQKELSPQVSAEIARLGASTVLIVGGEGVISQSIEQELCALSGVTTVHRIYGEDRQETAVKVFEEYQDSWGDTAIVAFGNDFADALCIGPFAYAYDAPMFLTLPNGTLDDKTCAAVQSGNFDRVILVGGDGIVSDAVMSQLGNSFNYERLGGNDRYQTSAAIGYWYIQNGYLDTKHIAVTTGLDYPDALTGSVYCGKNGSFLTLVDLGEAGAYTIDNIIARFVVEQGSIIGGEGVIPSGLRGFIQNSSTATVNPVLESRDYQLYYTAANEGYSLAKSGGTQLILVSSSGSEAKVDCYERETDGMFHNVYFIGTAYGFVGEEGVSKEPSEWKAATPWGLYTLPFAFGCAANPGTYMMYYEVTNQSWWVGDPNSSYYNTWVESSRSFGGNSEKLSRMSDIYRYAVVIGYNGPAYGTPSGNAVPGAGSAFFLHCTDGTPTVGCVSVEESVVVQILYWLEEDKDPHILIA